MPSSGEKRRAQQRAWRERNREKVKADSHAYRERTREKGLARNREWRERNREIYRTRERVQARDRKHGTDTGVLVATLLAAQAGACYLCGEPLDLVKHKGCYIDHDHSCCPQGRSCAYCRRGLACLRCNTLIGAVGDDPDLLRRIAANLEPVLAATRARIADKPQQLPLAL